MYAVNNRWNYSNKTFWEETDAIYTQKTLILSLESMEFVNDKFCLKEGQISFVTDSDIDYNFGSTDWAFIEFWFDGYNLRIPKEPEGVRYVTRLCVDLKDHSIFTIDPGTYERIELGTMPEFKTPEDAIGILEQFIEDLKEKE